MNSNESLATWAAVFQEADEMVCSRVGREIFTTEDTIRFLFTLSATKHLSALDQLVLEHPHPALPRKEIDLTILAPPLGPAHVEFKYHRPIPSARNQPMTQLLGSILADLVKLALCDSKYVRLFVYFAQGGMRGYIERRSDLPLFQAGSFALTPAFWEALPLTAKRQLDKALGTPHELPSMHLEVLEVGKACKNLASTLLYVKS